jgi:AcrR family transcriptional regulator
VPKQVDHQARRQEIADAVCRLVASRGLDAVSLRHVAAEAGVSMGRVQHYFATKDEMLLFALQQWLGLGVHDRFTARIRTRLAREATDAPVAALRAIAAEYLPHDAQSRSETLVALTFLSRAAAEPALAAALRPAFTGFVHALRGLLQNTGWPVDASAEAQRLGALLDGLRLPVLVGALSHEDALAVVDQHLAELTTRTPYP